MVKVLKTIGLAALAVLALVPLILLGILLALSLGLIMLVTGKRPVKQYRLGSAKVMGPGA